MSQSSQTATPTVNIGTIPRYILISLLTMFAFGPQYVLNVSFILNQTVIQNGFAVSSNQLLLPSVLSNLAFTLCVPFGPVFSRKYGVRQTYLTLVLIFLLGSIICSISPRMSFLVVGRLIQGLSAGTLFLTILPVSLVSFPSQVRNWFLLLAIGGLFGSSAVGALLGSCSLSTDAWRWLFDLCALPSLVCLFVGFFVLSRDDPNQQHEQPFDIWGAFLLVAMVTVVLFPSVNLTKLGIGSLVVWPFFLITLLLFAVFVVVEFFVESPLVPFRAIRSKKQVFGVIMAIASHIALIVVLIGMNGYLRNIRDIAFAGLICTFVWFIVGIVVAALVGTWLYDKLGAGALGLIGSIVVVFVSLQWRSIAGDASLATTNLQVGFVGGSIGLVLISGALGTAIAGDIHQARWRSITLHFTRNFIGAIAGPVIAWFLYRQVAIHYDTLRSQISLTNPQVTMEIATTTQRLMDTGLSAANAKSAAFASIMMSAQKTSLLDAYHDLFAFLLVLGIIMTVASIGMAATGKGRALVQKTASKPTSPSVAVGAPQSQN